MSDIQSALLKAMTSTNTLTENGMAAHSTSSNFCVDMFSKLGSMRGESEDAILNIFVKAFNEDKLTALRLLFWVRDVRGGAGEREIFKIILSYLAKNHADVLAKNIHLISEYGRWDDIFSLIDTNLEQEALELIRIALSNEDGLCAKWLPRQAKKTTNKGVLYNKIRKYLKLSPKEYRNLIVKLSNTVEQLMCDNNWSEIDFSKIPSKAMSDYMKSFYKHTPDEFSKYLESVKNGNAKINAKTLYPHDITKNLRLGNKEGASIQWNSLPNFMGDNTELVLPLVDVSGSMHQSVGGNININAMDVAVSLGLYISERNVGPFKDSFITFESNPKLEILKGDLIDRHRQLSRADWGGSTNLEKALSLIVKKGKEYNIPQSEMPTMLIILSDMQFNSAFRNNWNPTAKQLIDTLFNEAGYKVPKILFWNLAGRTDNTPIKFNDTNVSMVSGFSPSILVNALSGKHLTPFDMMMEVVNNKRYSQITI